MQQRRFRPGDVLDDYCPRERRITDHAVVAMIDDRIKQTRCVVCDAEHEYKEGKVPPQRRKRPQSALFAQVLDGLQAPQRVARRTDNGEVDEHPVSEPTPPASPSVPSLPHISGNGHDAGHAPVVTAPVPPSPVEEPPAPADEPETSDAPPQREEGHFRRSLIRATLPRPEGQPVVARALPDFTIRQPQNGRGGPRGGGSGGGRRRGGHSQHPQGQAGHGGGRFARHAQGPHGQGGRRQGGHGRPGGSRRGGKKR
jgi:hypothetical protein